VSTEFYWVAVVLTTVISASRFTRLATVDKFPPVKAIRNWYEDKTDGSDWQWLTLCGYCFSFWATWPIVVWGLLAGVYAAPETNRYDDIAFTAWWIFNGVFAMTYLAGVFMAYDGSDGEDE
jgi:hypothetical protein